MPLVNTWQASDDGMNASPRSGFSAPVNEPFMPPRLLGQVRNFASSFGSASGFTTGRPLASIVAQFTCSRYGVARRNFPSLRSST